MKNFIELPQKEGNILVSIASILMVRPSDFKKTELIDGTPVTEIVTPCTEILLSFVGNASISDIPNDTPPSKTVYPKPLSVHVFLPYVDVLKLIEAAL